MIIHAQWWSIPPDSNLESEMFPIFNFPFPKFFKWTLRLFLFFEYSEEAIWVLLLLHSTKESKRWRLERRTSNARLPKKRRISIPRSFRRRLFTCLLWMIHEEENAKKRAASIYYPPYLTSSTWRRTPHTAQVFIWCKCTYNDGGALGASGRT